MAPALLLLLVSALTIPAAALMAGASTLQVTVIAPPWYAPAEVIDLVGRAGGQVLNKGALDNVVIAVSGQPDFIAALHREGAWLTLDAGALGGCLNQ